MGDKSKIAWTDATWNPITGCTKISSACKNCYAEKMAKRLQKMGQPRYANGFKVTCHDDEKLLSQPSRWKKPRRIFPVSMGDIFHDEVPHSFLIKVYREMILADHHIFQVLTKRPQNMRDFLTWFQEKSSITPEEMKHVYHGVTVESSETLHRAELLSWVPSTVRFVSFEPWLFDDHSPLSLSGRMDRAMRLRHALNNIDWAIVGGESGPGARPSRLVDFRDLVDISREANCKIFVKQMGAVWAKRNNSKSRKGEIISEWPEDLQIQEVPWTS